METKKSREWEAMRSRFEHITDTLGMPIDKGILDAVIVLNLLGVTTRQSCEGHLDRGDCAPWISFTTLEATPMYKQAAQEHDRAMCISKEKKYTYEELQGLFAPARELRSRADALHAFGQRKVLSLLEVFYSERYISHDCMLVVYSRVPGSSILESQGAKLQIIREEDEKAVKLCVYQQEMQHFARFLKERFLYE